MRLDLDLSLERPEPLPIFRPGEKIRGVVKVRAEQACRCERLSVSLGWRTRGKGNVQKRTVQEVTLFGGAWTAAQEQSYPFELDVPPGPFSYAGTLIQVDWAVRAHADLPWAIDPEQPYRILVRPWDADSLPEPTAGHYRDAPRELEDGFESGDPVPTPAEAAKVRDGETGCLLGCGSLLTLVGLFGFLLILLPDPSAPVQLVFALPFGLGMLITALVRRWSARRLGGAPTVALDPEIVEEGERLEVRVSFTVPRATELEEARATFRAREEAVSGSGKNKRTHEELLHVQMVELAPAGALLDAGTPCELRCSFDVPAAGPTSFQVDSNKVEWSVELVVNPKGAPAWSRRIPFTVRPRRIERFRGA